MDRVTVRAVSIVRAVLVTALLGHWIANALFDEAEYAGADAELIARLDRPFLVQAALGLSVIALLSLGRARAHRVVVMRRLPLAALLVGVQFLLFVALESSERIAVDLFAGGTTDVGMFGTGFVAELLVAVAAALILAFVAEAAKRWLQDASSVGRRAANERRFRTALASLPMRGSLGGAGSVRAPPSGSPARSS